MVIVDETMDDAPQARVLRPPAPLQFGTVLWMFAAAGMAAQVDAGFLLKATVLLLGGSLGVAWCLFACSMVVPALFAGKKPGVADVAAWLFCPAVGALFAALVLTRVPLRVRVALDHAALVWFVDEARSTPDLALPTHVGTFAVEGVDVGERCTFLQTDDGFMWRWYGLASAPDGGRPEGRFRGFQTNFRHLTGRWWMFHAWD